MSFISRFSRSSLTSFQRHAGKQAANFSTKTPTVFISNQQRSLLNQRNQLLINAARASKGQGEKPAQAAFALGVLLLPAGTLAGVCYICMQLGLGETILYRLFEDKVVEKQILRRMSSIGQEKAKQKRALELAAMKPKEEKITESAVSE